MTLNGTFLGLALLAGIALTPSATLAPAPRAADTYEIDGGHSSILFSIRHLGVGQVYGRFNEFTGNVSLDTAKLESSKVEMEIDVGTIDTGIDKRDNHLKSPDFFDAKQFPKATFKSTGVRKKDETHVTVTGDLSMHGVTKPVTFDLEMFGPKSTDRGERVGFHGQTTIKRSDFGIKFMLPDALGDEVAIVVGVQAVKGGGGKR